MPAAVLRNEPAPVVSVVSTSVAVGLVLIDLGVLIYLIDHVAKSIQLTSVVSRALARTHIVGPNRTLTQDPGFAIDQLVEVALRSLSPAVNDTFTALNCIDWLGDCPCHAHSQRLPSGIYCDECGNVRVIEPVISHERLLNGATDRIRQAGRGMPAIRIRQLENLQKVMTLVSTPGQREVVLHHARMVFWASDESVGEESDRRMSRPPTTCSWLSPATCGTDSHENRVNRRTF